MSDVDVVVGTAVAVVDVDIVDKFMSHFHQHSMSNIALKFLYYFLDSVRRKCVKVY